MTPTKGVTDEQRGKIYKKINAIIDRTGEGKSLDFDWVMKELQVIHDRRKCLSDPHEFFQNREGLWRSDTFVRQILSVAKKTERIQLPDHIPSFTLPKSMGDSEIRRKLGDNHVFGASEGCTVIAGMISHQQNGKNGDLINNGKANIFYVRGKDDGIFTVSVYWVAGGREWGVNAIQFDDNQWLAGRRCFSHNSIFGS